MEQAAEITGVCEATVRRWIKEGLPVMTDKRPALVLGCDLKAFLTNRNNRKTGPLGPGELYCCRCKSARKPAGDMLDYLPLSEQHGRLAGFCSVCETSLSRLVSVKDLPDWEEICDVVYNCKTAA